MRALARTKCGSYVLIRRAVTDRSFPGKWELPGGVAEAGEAPTDAVVREVAEETGIVCTTEPRLVAQARRRSPRARLMRELCYEVETTGEPALSPEHDAVALYRPGGRLPGELTDSAATFLRRAA